MGRFNCVQCGCAYYDRRFRWESVDTSTAGAAKASTDIASACGECKDELASEASTSPGSRRCVSATTSTAWTSSESGECFSEQVSDDDSASFHREGDPDGSDMAPISSFRLHVDLGRANCTIANLVGSAIPTFSPTLSPDSSSLILGGMVGAAHGVEQLHAGFATKSQIPDPHLVMKGGVATSIGGMSLMLSAAAANPTVFPLFMFASSICLAVNIGIDVCVDGLCPSCREEAPAEEEAEPAGAYTLAEDGDVEWDVVTSICEGWLGNYAWVR